jgi:hypothetical protein
MPARRSSRRPAVGNNQPSMRHPEALTNRWALQRLEDCATYKKRAAPQLEVRLFS